MSCSKPPVGPAGKVRVVVVDADIRVVVALRSLIGAEPDLEVAGVTSQVSAAQDLAARFAPCVVLVDTTLPDLPTGASLVHLLSRTAGCRVIAMSIHGGDRVAAHLAGAQAFVTKGEDVDAMLSAIRDAGAARA